MRQLANIDAVFSCLAAQKCVWFGAALGRDHRYCKLLLSNVWTRLVRTEQSCWPVCYHRRFRCLGRDRPSEQAQEPASNVDGEGFPKTRNQGVRPQRSGQGGLLRHGEAESFYQFGWPKGLSSPSQTPCRQLRLGGYDTALGHRSECDTVCEYATGQRQSRCSPHGPR
jgi:hypothetical protein